MKRTLVALLCVGLLLTTSPQPGRAQDVLPGRTREVRVACAGDYLRFCRNVTPGGGRVLLCMNLHADKLSQSCFQALTAWGLAVVNAFKVCLPDAERLCAHVPPGAGRGLACILQNADKLSRPCRDALAGHEPFNGGPERRKGPW